MAHRWANNRNFVLAESNGEGAFAGTTTDFYTSDDQRWADSLGHDHDDLWQVSFDLTKTDGTLTEVALLRAKPWLGSHQINRLGDRSYLSLPEMGVEGLVRVTGMERHTA